MDDIVKGEGGTVLTDNILPVRVPVRTLLLPELLPAERLMVDRLETEGPVDGLLVPRILGPDREFDPKIVDPKMKPLTLIGPAVALNPKVEVLGQDMPNPERTEPDTLADSV